MTLVFSMRSAGGKTFSGELINADDPDNTRVLDLTGAQRYFIVFRRPDGVYIERDGAVNPDPSINDDDRDVYFTTTADDPILTMRGHWEYVVGVEFSNGTKVSSPYTIPFDVVD